MTPPGWNSPTLLWVVSASVLAAGLFVWPLHIVLAAGQNASLALGLGFGWALVMALAQPIGQAGVAPGVRRTIQILDVIALAGVLSLDSVVLNQLASMLQSVFYYDTPRSALLLPLLVVVGVVVNRTPDTTWRLTTFFVPLLFGTSLAIFLVALMNVDHPRALGPNPHIAVMPVLHGLGIIAYIGVPFGVTLRRAGAHLAEPPGWVWRLGTVCLPAVFLGALYVITVGALGPAALTQVRWPVVFVLDHVTLDSAFFLSRIGIAVVFSWSLGVTLGLIVHLRLVWTLVPVRPWTRLGGSMAILAGWAVVALILLPSPLASTRVLLRWLDPGAVWYLLGEMMVVGGVGLVTRRRARNRS